VDAPPSTPNPADLLAGITTAGGTEAAVHALQAVHDELMTDPEPLPATWESDPEALLGWCVALLIHAHVIHQAHQAGLPFAGAAARRLAAFAAPEVGKLMVGLAEYDDAAEAAGEDDDDLADDAHLAQRDGA